MLPQLLKITNAYNGRTVYMNMNKIVMFVENIPTTPKIDWAYQPVTEVYYGPGEDDFIWAAEAVKQLLERFPPV